MGGGTVTCQRAVGMMVADELLEAGEEIHIPWYRLPQECDSSRAAPPPFPFFTHFCCVAGRWADTRADDRAPRSIAEANDAMASASERTST